MLECADETSLEVEKVAYKCPKCGKEYQKPGKCPDDGSELVRSYSAEDIERTVSYSVAVKLARKSEDIEKALEE